MTQEAAALLQPLYVTLVTGTVDNVTRIVLSDSTGKEVGILCGVQSASFHVDASSTTSVLNLSTLNLSVVRSVGHLESGSFSTQAVAPIVTVG